MSAGKIQEEIDEIFERFKNGDHKAQVTLLEEINEEILNFLTEEIKTVTQQMVHLFFLSRISESEQEEEFDKLLNIDRNKKGRCQRLLLSRIITYD